MCKDYRVDIVYSEPWNIIKVSIANYTLKKIFESYGIRVLPYISGYMYIQCDRELLAEFIMNYDHDSLVFSCIETLYPHQKTQN